MPTVTLPGHRERFTSACIPSHPSMSTIEPMRMPACAPAGPQPLLQSCQGSGGSTLRCRPFHSIASSSAPSAALFREGRRRRDGATGTTGTGLLLMTTARRSSPATGSRRVNCRLPGARRCARSEPARGSARLLTARTSARPDFPFSRLISRLDCAQLRTRSVVKMGPTVACRAHNGRAVGTSKKRLRMEGPALTCARSTRHPAGQELQSAAFQRARLRTSNRRQKRKSVVWMRSVAHVQARTGRQAGVDPAHQQRAVEQVRKPAKGSEVRTINAQIGTQQRSSTCSLTARSAAKRKGWRVIESGRQDKRIVSAVSVFAADSGTCRADMEAEGHTNIRRQGKRKQGALFVSSCAARTCRNL